MNKEELVKLIYENFFDKISGTIDLSSLDFTKYHCDVDISEMKVEGILYQCNQKVKELIQ